MGSSNYDMQWLTKTRKALRKANIQDDLLKHLRGEIELTQSQIQCAITLLDRVLPKLSNQTIEVKDERKDYRNMSREELAATWDQIVEQMRQQAPMQ